MKIEDIEQFIKSNDAVLLYFSGENCSVCKALQPKIKSSFELHFPKIKQQFISASAHPIIAAHFNIFSIPSVLIYFDGKETKRESRYISVDELLQKVKRPYTLFFDKEN